MEVYYAWLLYNVGAEVSEVQKSLHSFNTDDACIKVQPISEDPANPDFMGFRLTKKKKRRTKELSRFRADNIVHMRNFMVSLLVGVAQGSLHLKLTVSCR